MKRIHCGRRIDTWLMWDVRSRDVINQAAIRKKEVRVQTTNGQIWETKGKTGRTCKGRLKVPFL